MLSTWAEIAKYIGKSTKTAKKYHHRYGMPIYRTPGGQAMALEAEIARWLVEFTRSGGGRKNFNFPTNAL